MNALMVIFTITFGASLWSARNGPYAMRGAVTFMMTLVSLFAPLQSFFFGYTSNVANIWYTAVIAMQITIAINTNWRLASSTIFMALFWLFVLQMTIYGMSLVEPIGSGRVFIDEIHVIAYTSPRITIASWLAFLLASSVGVFIIFKFKNKISLILLFLIACISAQAIDSLTFFPLAFGDDSQMIEIMLSGFIIKSILTIPFIDLLFITPKIKNILWDVKT